MDNRRGLQLWGPVGRWAFLNWPRGSWQYDLICGAIIVGLFVLPNPQPQSMDVDGVLAAVEAADAEIESFTADALWTVHIDIFDDTEIEKGTVAFLKPAFFRRDITDPSERIEVVGNDEVTLYIPRVKQAQIISIEGSLEEGQDLVIPGLASSSELKSAYDVSLQETTTDPNDGATLYVLRLIPNLGTTPAKHYKAIILEVAEGEWHPARRIILESHVDDTTTIELTNVVLNPGLEPDDFVLDLPDDTEIIKRAADTN